MFVGSSDDARERVRQAVDIVDLVGSHIPLRRQGRNFVGLCPWHDDARPSLQVNPERQSWKCWVCDLGGDIFSFVMQRERVEFREALELLADRAGIDITPAARTRPGEPNDKKTLYAAVQWAAEQFSQCLGSSSAGAIARDYFAQRGLTSESLQQFQLGFAPNQWQWLLDRASGTPYSPAVLEAAGLVAKSADSGRYYDRFRGRVIFPICDTQKRPIAFGGRILPQYADDSPAKYVNSPENRLFSKSEHLYGLERARDTITKTGRAVVVEGYTDVIMAHQRGLTDFVAVLGTALGSKHIQLLRRYADSITLVLDGDEAGQRRTNEVLELFVASEIDLKILTLPDGADPCDFVAQQGAEAMQAALAGAPDAFTHAIQIHTADVDLLRDTHRANEALEQLLSVVAKAPRLSSDTKTSRLLRERQVLARLARDFFMEESALRDRLAEIREQGTQQRTNKLAESGSPITGQEITPTDRELLEILAVHHDLADLVVDELRPSELPAGPVRTILLAYDACTAAGETPEFSRILASLEDPQLKSLFVEIDERARDKDELAQEDAAVRLRHVLDELNSRDLETQRRQAVAALDQQLSPEEELQILNDLVERERKRQGIPAPTDG